MTDLIVHQLPGAWGLPSISPFCLKLEAYLRMVGIPFRSVVDPTPFKGPKGKLPWIEHGARRIGDSGFIIDYLERTFGCDPDRGLDARSRAVGHALRRLIEENLYWTMVYDRWMVEANWNTFRNVVLGGVPAPLRPLVAVFARRGVHRELVGHGIGKHTTAEIHEIGVRDIDAVAAVLGDQPYLLGDEPTSIDATAYAFIVNIVRPPVASPVQVAGNGHPNLLAFLERFEQRFLSAAPECA